MASFVSKITESGRPGEPVSLGCFQGIEPLWAASPDFAPQLSLPARHWPCPISKGHLVNLNPSPLGHRHAAILKHAARVVIHLHPLGRRRESDSIQLAKCIEVCVIELGQFNCLLAAKCRRWFWIPVSDSICWLEHPCSFVLHASCDNSQPVHRHDPGLAYILRASDSTPFTHCRRILQLPSRLSCRLSFGVRHGFGGLNTVT